MSKLFAAAAAASLAAVSASAQAKDVFDLAAEAIVRNDAVLPIVTKAAVLTYACNAPDDARALAPAMLHRMHAVVAENVDESIEREPMWERVGRYDEAFEIGYGFGVKAVVEMLEARTPGAMASMCSQVKAQALEIVTHDG
jgi:hypothetical protein